MMLAELIVFNAYVVCTHNNDNNAPLGYAWLAFQDRSDVTGRDAGGPLMTRPLSKGGLGLTGAQ